MLLATENTRRPRRADRYAANTPERVSDAAARMSSASSGTHRGYVPEPGYTGNYNVPQAGAAVAPVAYQTPPQARQVPAQAQQAQAAPGQGYPLQGTGRGYVPPQPAARQNAGASAPAGQQGAGRSAHTSTTARYRTGSYDTVNGLRGYVTEEKTPDPPKKKRGRRIGAILGIILLTLAIGTGGVFAAMSYMKTKEINDKVEPYNNLFCPGVYVDGISLGGMTPEQALNSVQSQIRQRNDAWSVQLTYEGETLAVINAGMLGMSVDIGEVMNNAWIQGHEGDNEQRYQAMLALEETPYHGYTAVPTGDTSVIDSLLTSIRGNIEKPAKDAALVSFDTSLPYPFTFTEEEYGLRLDTAPIIEQLYHMVSEMQNGVVEIKPETVAPNVTKTDLQKHYMLRSSAYTPISSSSTEDRNNNIRHAFEFIDGYILEPGKSFSFNGVVGERTVANGFFPAIEYAYGEHVEGVGGGVCQASTTVYQAAVEAGLQIVKREPHSDAVSYTEYGKDATVYWLYKRKIDLVFKNNTEEPIYIVAAVQEDPSNKRRLIAKVSMYGADMGDVRYELVSEVVEEIEAPTEPVYVKDKNAEYVTYTDQQKSVSKAQPGYVVQSYREEYAGNVLRDRQPLYTDTYEPKPERIYVGTTRRE